MRTQHALLLSFLAAAGWSSQAFAQSFIDLGSASAYGVLAGSTVANTGFTVVTGDLGVSGGTTVTGFPPGVVNGTIHLGDASSAQAHADLASALSTAAGKAVQFTVASELGSTVLTPGVYHSTAGTFGLTGTFTLSGSGPFLFKMDSTFTTAADSQITLINGASADSIYWLIGSSATFGANSQLAGNFLAHTSITLGAGSTVDGRLLALDGAVTMSSSAITAIPEPATTAALMAGCFGLLAGAHRIRRKRAERIRAAAV